MGLLFFHTGIHSSGPARRSYLSCCFLPVVLLVAGLLILAAAVVWWQRSEPGGSRVRVPGLSAQAQAGSAVGPTLVHRVYQPGHHADVAFELAVRRGVPAHHWRFGDMPPQPAVAPTEIAQITRYVRELQRANGIE
jgi:hypothetical protein